MAKLNIKLKIEIIIALLVIICALLGFAVSEKVETYVFEQDAKYYINGIDYSVSAGDKARIDEETNKVIIVRNDGTELTSNGLPIYINDEDSILLINDMAYFRNSSIGLSGFKLTYFTKVYSNKNLNSVKLLWQDKAGFEEGGFLFDGDNTYVLLEKAYLQYNDKQIELSPLSHVIATRDGYIEYFDYDKQYHEYEDLNTNVEIRDYSDKYRIVADYDFVYVGSDVFMLQKNVSNYGPYFAKEETEWKKL